MRHHVGGTHNDGYGHGHETGPMYKLDLTALLERDKARKRHKKLTRLQREMQRRLRRSGGPSEIKVRREPTPVREEHRSFAQRVKEKAKGFVSRLFGRKTG